MPSPPDSSPALKEIFDASFYRRLAQEIHGLLPTFDQKRFLALVLQGLSERSLLQRLRRTSEALHETLPSDFPTTLRLLRKLAPRLQHSFAALVLPDYVALYGREHYTLAVESLAFFTRFGSSEFAIRSFLKGDLKRTLETMCRWADDSNEHVRRLASEGSRPRLPWSFRLQPIVADPDLTAPILAKLMDDPSLYVRKSVANHLNDISKDHPEWLIEWLRKRDLTRPHSRWIAKRALRSLIKQGRPEALALVGATGKAEIKTERFQVTPKKLRLGSELAFHLAITSASGAKQHLVIDYAVHYVKASGAASAKVFKWKAVDLEPAERLELTKRQRIQDFTTRKHYAGTHQVDLLINGTVVARAAFELVV